MGRQAADKTCPAVFSLCNAPLYFNQRSRCHMADRQRSVTSMNGVSRGKIVLLLLLLAIAVAADPPPYIAATGPISSSLAAVKSGAAQMQVKSYPRPADRTAQLTMASTGAHACLESSVRAMGRGRTGRCDSVR